MNKYLQIITAIYTVIIIPLVVLIYNDLKDDISVNCTKIESVDDKKVNNTTLKMMLDQQNIIIKNNKEEFNRVYRQIRDIRMNK